jgi:hypothetical protein
LRSGSDIRAANITIFCKELLEFLLCSSDIARERTEVRGLRDQKIRAQPGHGRAQ